MAGITGGIPGIIGGTPVNIGGMPLRRDMKSKQDALLFELHFVNFWHTHLHNQRVACLGPELPDACLAGSLGACRQPEVEQQAAEMKKGQLHHHHHHPPRQNHLDSVSSSDYLLRQHNKVIFL